MTDADEVVTLPVPEMVSALYFVAATTDPPPDLRQRLARSTAGRFSPFLRSMLDDWIASPDTPAEVVRVGDVPLPPLELLTGTPEQLDRIAKATHLVVVKSLGSPKGPPLASWTSRAMAGLVAEIVDGDVIDTLTHHVPSPEHIARSLPSERWRANLADWVQVEHSPDRLGYWCTTNGLRRYGLPELQTLSAPPNMVEQWCQAMCGIAVVLLTAWDRALNADHEPAFVQLPALLTVTADDVATAYGKPRLGGPTAQVRLTVDPRGPEHHSFLTTHPPLDWSGSAGEHISDVCAALFGPRASEVRPAHHGDAMDSAIAIARAGLTDIRGRFESGQLHLRTKLLVKYALPADEGTEYLWAYVTSWRDPYRILATSAVDAVYHPRIRAGRPVVVDTASVVDWALEHDEHGVLEGGWTQTALDEDRTHG